MTLKTTAKYTVGKANQGQTLIDITRVASISPVQALNLISADFASKN